MYLYLTFETISIEVKFFGGNKVTQYYPCTLAFETVKNYANIIGFLKLMLLFEKKQMNLDICFT